MTKAERTRLANWLYDNPGVTTSMLMWIVTGGWMGPVFIGSAYGVIFGWATLVPFLVGPAVLGFFLNQAVLSCRVRRGGAVAYEYSAERLYARERAVQRREQAVRELERRAL